VVTLLLALAAFAFAGLWFWRLQSIPRTLEAAQGTRYAEAVNSQVGYVPDSQRPAVLAEQITSCLLGAVVGFGPAQGQMVNAVTVDLASINDRNGIISAEADVTITDGSSYRVIFNTNGDDWSWVAKS
jgi:hypothetical protein